jgi:hypothetical protein
MNILFPLVMLFRVTFYHATGYPMANGEFPYPGAAACSTHFSLGTVIRLAGPAGWYDVTCADRGHINGGMPWVDIFAPTAEDGRFIARNFSPHTYGIVVEPD